MVVIAIAEKQSRVFGDFSARDCFVAFVFSQLQQVKNMRQAIAVHKSGHWPEEASIDRVTLAFVDRHRRRLRLVADSGNSFLLDLPRVQHLADGDGLELDDGGYVRVCSAPERVLEIEADGPAELLRLAWHLGNRHLPVQALDGRLRTREDYAMAQMG